MGKMSYKYVRIISFCGVISIHKLYHENMPSSVLLETSCYHNTLATSLKIERYKKKEPKSEERVLFGNCKAYLFFLCRRKDCQGNIGFS